MTRKAARSSSAVSRWATRVRERLARSRRVFLTSLIIACGIEVAVDWNSTLFEINVLRGRVAERGTSYVHILAGAAGEAMRTKNTRVLGRLTEGLFSDEQVVFARFVDTAGNPLFEQIDPRYAADFQRRRSTTFQSYYDRQLSRDLNGVMHDPSGQQQRMAKSRYRDFPQRWNDALHGVLATFVSSPAARTDSGLVLYQQAVRTETRERENRERDASVTWAFGPVVEPSFGSVGAVLVAFDMTPTNNSIRNKYLKGLGMVLFFVGLILFQNLSSRQDKLRLLDMEKRYAQAKAALRDALPGVVCAGELTAFGALDQAQGTVDGQLYVLSPHPDGIDVLIVDPDGSGIEAATLALQARRVFLERRAAGPVKDLGAEMATLGSAAMELPLSRPLGVVLASIKTGGTVSALCGPLGGMCVLGSEAPVVLGPKDEAEAPAGLMGPLRRYEAQLGPGDRLVIGSAGIVAADPHAQLNVDALARFLARSDGTGSSSENPASDATSWVRGRTPGLSRADLVVLLISRA